MQTTTLLVRFSRCLAPLLLAGAASAGNGGFNPGELVLYNSALHGGSSTAGGLVRIDPSTGLVTQLLDLTGGSQQMSGSMAYDPFRDRVIFVGAFPTTSDPKKLWLIDAVGNTTDLGFAGTSLSAMAPASGGRIYMRGPGSTAPLRYLDAANQLQTLMDVGGTQPFAPASTDIRAMLYDAGTNALFMATNAGNAWTCGSPTSVNLHRVRLTPDGTAVAAVDGCVDVPVDPASANVVVGLSHAAGGQVLLVVDTNSNTAHPRMNLIDPRTLQVTPFASNGPYTGAAATNAGSWSTQLGRAVIFDTFSDVLRAYALGESGNGTVIVPSSQISSPGGSGEIATLVEVPTDSCAGLVGTYCTAKTTSGGCLPVIDTSGCPSASAPSGFTVEVSQVETQNVGIFFYGKSGPVAAPFQGGFLCVQAPIRRTPPSSSGGSGACGGMYSIDFNSYVASGADLQLVPGSVVHGQFWFRDPPEPISGTGLSAGVTFTLAP